MNIVDVLAENKMELTSELYTFIGRAAQEVFQYSATMGLSEFEIGKFISGVELKDADVMTILVLAARYSRLWAFS